MSVRTRPITRALTRALTGHGAGPLAAHNDVAQYMRVFNASALQFGAEDFTVVAWVKTNTQTPVGQNRHIVSKDTTTTGWSLFDRGPSAQFAFGIRNLSAIANGAAGDAPGAWHMVAGGHDQAAAQVWCSVDAAAATTTARATAPTVDVSDLAIGQASNFPGSSALEADILRIGIWRRKLSAADLTALYNGTTPLRYADLTAAQKVSLEAWWDMNEASGKNRRESHAGLYHAFDQFGVTTATGRAPAVTVVPITKNLIAAGDSMTIGYNEVVNYSYPYQAGLDLGANWKITNTGVLGRQSNDTKINAAAEVDPFYSAQYTKNIAILWIGINDFLNLVASATIKANITTWVTARKAVGWKTVVLTNPPSLYAARPGSYDADNASLNAWIIANSAAADAVCNSGANASLADPNNTTYFNSDKLHLTKYGYQKVARDVVTTVSGL